jgi:hypothetical protein
LLAPAVRGVVRSGARGTDRYARMAAEIGAAVSHSTNTVYLDYDFGAPLCYLAAIAGAYWPESDAMALAAKQGGVLGPLDPGLSAKERFDRFYLDRRPEYFIISRLPGELDRQVGLRDFLFSNFAVATQGERYLIFDLRKQPMPTGDADAELSVQ